MSAPRHLQGVGEYTYDYANDVLYFTTKHRTYAESIEFENLIIDIDDEHFIVGIRILDASRTLHLPKYALKSIRQFDFASRFDQGAVTVQLNFTARLRNKVIVNKGQDILRDAPFTVAEPHTVAATA
jgi:uncharacterized protein YuzE